MIRLTKSVGAQEVVIRVEGRLDAESLEGLCRALAAYGPDDPVTVDLAGVASIDAAAREYLVGLRRVGRRLTGGSLFVGRFLKEDDA